MESVESSTRRAQSQAMMCSPIDLSHHLHPGVQVFPGDRPYTCTPISTILKDGYSVHEISLSTHTGTHVDAPSHFFPDGKTIDQIPFPTFIKPALVVDVTQKKPREKILWDDLAPYERQMKDNVILLLHTGWSDYWCTPKYYEHPFLDPAAAGKIMEKGIRVIGVDAMSVDETCTDGSVGKDGFGVHQVVLGSDGIIAENLTNLKALEGGVFMVSLIPLNLDGMDGSPVRAFAWSM